jgi:protein TIF31
MHKVLTDFGEASVLGVKAISEGLISAMNPNEGARSQVFLHNNIFFSRAVDAGVETFKIAKGDNAARKSASRDIQCIGTLHRMDTLEVHTLATVLIDYMGTRTICQSILPGILNGDKTHTLLYGAVEAGCELKYDEDMHKALENTVGKTLQVATRLVPRQPLAPDRLEEVKRIKSTLPTFMHMQHPVKDTSGKEAENTSPTIASCAPLEAKGIRGSDQRKYILDISRVTPRDANWVSKEKGGTGMWEDVLEKTSAKSASIPTSLDDDEWILAVLRPELVTRFLKIRRELWLKSISEKEKVEAGEKDSNSKETKEEEPSQTDNGTDATENAPENELPDSDKGPEDVEAKHKVQAKEEKSKEAKVEQRKLTDEEVEHLKTFRMNINVFLPDVRTLGEVDNELAGQVQEDEERAREAALLLWDHILPRFTMDIREATGVHQQIPPDGRSLTEMLHQQGINCRYLGRLAMLAQLEEDMDKKLEVEIKNGNVIRLGRRKMPLYWLELLECEMVARAAKHVLDSYLTENGGTAASQPSQTIASFLSALVSESEETAAQTETRMGKKKGGPDEDDFNALTLCDTGGGGDAMPGAIRTRSEVWRDIAREVGRRFRYSLTLYNVSGKDSRALYIPLLRRVCQRTGVRLVAKNYDVGGKCLCSGGNSAGGRLTASYPIEPTDVVDVVPLMKHAAAHVEGFVPCAMGTTVGLPSLHISLADARTILEAAHLHCNARSLSPALDLAQEAASLYQRVTETPAHPGVVRCMDLMATILFEAGEPALAANSALKGLGLLVQVAGFDSFDTISAHLTLFQMLMSSQQADQAVKHIRAALYLMEVLAGPHYVEHSNVYHKLGTLYHGAGNVLTALRFYQEAGARVVSDRLHEGMIMRSTSMVLAALGQLKLAVQTEKKAYQTFSLMFGEEHNMTKASDATLKNFTKAAVEQGSRLVEDDKKRKEEQAAAAMASQMEADEEAEEKKKKRNSKKKKGKK